MALNISLTFNGVQYSSYVRLASIKIKESLRDRAGSLTGLQIVIPYSGSTPAVAIPRAGHEAVLTVNGSTEFGGIVQRVRETPAGSSSFLYEVDCADYVRWFDRYLVQGVTYPTNTTSATAGSIIKSIITDYCNKGLITWGQSLIEAGNVIQAQTFDFEPPSQCIDRIAKQIGYIWYVDYNKNVVFRSSLSTGGLAPVATFNYESGTTLFDMTVEETGDQIINVAYIKDAKAVATNPETGVELDYGDGLGDGDGYRSFFSLGYEPASMSQTSVTVTLPSGGGTQTYTTGNGKLKQENIDGQPGDGKTNDVALLCLPNWGVRFQQPPPAGATVSATYKYLDIGPAVWKVTDPTSITEVKSRESNALSDGIYEEVFSASDLIAVGKQTIEDRATLYLNARRHKWQMTCGAYGTGWAAGQSITITSSKRFGGQFASGVKFWVTDIEKSFPTPDVYINKITLSSDIFGEL